MPLRFLQLLLVAVFFVSASLSNYLQAQAGKLPPFRMLQANGKVFKAEELPMGKPIVLIYFSPDCDHCNVMTKEMVKQKDKYKNASVAMVTYLPVDQVSAFVQKHGLGKLSNFYVGTEGTSFFLRNYYRLNKMPFLALYTKEGNLVKSYLDEHGMPDLVKRLSLLK